MDFLDDIPDLELPSVRPQHTRPSEPSIPTDTDGLPMVPYYKPKCPICKSSECPVYDSNHKPIRYHKCAQCGLCFKSVEIDP